MSQRIEQLMKGFMILSALVITPGLGSSLVEADTLLTRIYVEDISGSLANSPASPVAPLLDSNYVLDPLFSFLDSAGVDSITRVFPYSNPADSLFVRPDGSIVKLSDWSDMYILYLSDSVVWDDFRDAYLVLVARPSGGFLDKNIA